MTQQPLRVIVGISGSSGIIYGVRLLEELKKHNVETHLVVSKAGLLTLAFETSMKAAELKALADYSYKINDITAGIASGSFKTHAMVVAPCSMNTLGEIAHSLSANLLARAADVILKERRKLILLSREAPLHLGHLQNMVKVTQMGGIIYPPVPALYNNPQSIDDIVTDTVGRVLDLLEIDNCLVKRWGEP
jgi:4-hydroxy-3-polyprenylbenzoate decarboxylase